MRFQWIETLSLFILFSTFLLAESFYKNSRIENNGADYCSTCHTPTSTDLNISDPLWLNKNVSHEFETYSTDNNSSQHGFPSGETKLCLGCHDGTVAVEDKNIYTNSNQLNNNLRMEFSSHNDHPVSILYNSSLAFSKGDLADPSYAPSGLGGTIEEDLLEDGKIVCTSCHLIHPTMDSEYTTINHFNTSESRVSMLLKISNDGSKLCLTCHRK